MFRHFIAALAIGCCAAPAGAAERNSPPQEPAGIALGAVIGGLIGGPPGAIIGAAGGGWLGNRSGRKDERIADLEQRLAGREAEFALLQDEFADLQQGRGAELQRTAFAGRHDALSRLSSGVSLTVHFRTASAELDAAARYRIRELARFLNDFPEIRLLLDAHADRRGSAEYNQRLSVQRAQAVRDELLAAGLDPDRVREHAWGASQATAAAGDREGLMFDRRVGIQLSLDGEA